MHYSEKWKTWKAVIDLSTCLTCRKSNGKVYAIDYNVDPAPPIHENCRCLIGKLIAIAAGKATKKGIDGADWSLKYHGVLPNYYIDEDTAKSLGYKSYFGNLSIVAPGRMLTKGIYNNRDGHLPSATGRIWYEADINYKWGYRGSERILFSNDGLIFVTYDHFKTFIEVE